MSTGTQLLSAPPPGALPAIWKQVGEEVDLQEMAKLLQFSKKDVAVAARVSESSFSYQKQLPPELRQRVMEWAAVLELVAAFYGGDAVKTAQWFRTPNYMLGGTEPRKMIRFGRANKLIQIIQDEIAGNVP